MDTLPSSNSTNPNIADDSTANSSDLKLRDIKRRSFQALENGLTSSRLNEVSLSRAVSTDSESSENYSRVPKSYRVKMGEKILSQMMKYVNDDIAYLHYFKQLVEFEELLKYVDFNRDKKFRIEPLDELRISRHNKTKNSGSHSNKNKNNHDKIIQKGSDLKHMSLDPIRLNSEFTSECLMKMQLRRALLKNFPMFVSNEKQFGNFLNSLIEFEEDLIKDE